MRLHDTEKYILLKGDTIVRVYKTAQGKAGILQAIKNERITEYDEIRKVPNDTEYKTKSVIQEYDNRGKLRPMEDRIVDGFRPCPTGYKVDKNSRQIVEKTDLEKLRDGEKTLGEHEVYDESAGVIREKTPEELYTPEELAKMEEERLIAEEERAILREQAVARLVAAGKIKVK